MKKSLSEDEQRLRRPLPVDVLIDAQNDKIHEDVTDRKPRAAKVHRAESNTEIVTYNGIRYKLFLHEKKTEDDSGISTVHIERSSGSNVFEKMTNDEIAEYVLRVVRHVLASDNFVGSMMYGQD
jgi:hypothetical protein